MSDIALTWDQEIGAADMAVAANDLQTDDGLETAVILSLFTDRRAEDGDVLPDDRPDRRGWWGDTQAATNGDRFGSRLWLLRRAKTTPDLPAKAKAYATEALQWMVDDKVADRLDVESGIVVKGVLGLTISIYRPQADPVRFRYHYTWAAQAARRA